MPEDDPVMRATLPVRRSDMISSSDNGIVLLIHRMLDQELLSAAFEEKVAQHGAALFGEEAGLDFDPVIELRVVHNGEDGTAGSGLGVVGGIYEAGDPSVEDRSGAHR